MTPIEAYEYASSWGSFARSGDPGACMYGFNSDCRPQSEEHRQDVINCMKTCRLNVVERPENFDDDELEKMDAFVEFISKRNGKGKSAGSFITEIGLCGSGTCCTHGGNDLEGEMLSDTNDCNRSGDAELACKYILDNYKPEFRIERRVGDVYQNVIASKEEKLQVCREIYGGSDTNFNDEDNANLYLVWAAASDLEAMQEAK
ncbi:hypothetical protein FF011L_05530 [Roseimaritima multifibrata]|uniref:Uncharacterized protein n=1 Tax=Roseimaritima multifibrata TaxID=1930274 RepID=A0A517MAA1_9BACT|nr:hypothetical protein [Roseimaritima multifibrata]QDS91818.1 hypothetical protein FF011L_05530 [Roseimaritima multifibrata]